MPEISREPVEVAAMLEDGREIAFLDVREIVPFGTGHPLLATHVPLGHIEFEIAALVPRRDTRVIVTDGGDGLSAVAAHRLARLGYANVAVLAGGAPAWADAGLGLFPEIEVLSKGFGDFVVHNVRPRFITPRELERAMASGEDWVLIDSRPRREYQAGNIPGSIDAPAGQMLRCFGRFVLLLPWCCRNAEMASAPRLDLPCAPRRSDRAGRYHGGSRAPMPSTLVQAPGSPPRQRRKPVSAPVNARALSPRGRVFSRSTAPPSSSGGMTSRAPPTSSTCAIVRSTRRDIFLERATPRKVLS